MLGSRLEEDEEGGGSWGVEEGSLGGDRVSNGLEEEVGSSKGKMGPSPGNGKGGN